MSNAKAIAAVTLTLKNLLLKAVEMDNVTLKPPDKARDATVTTEQLNIFLYNTPVAAAFRNSDPAGLRPGESGQPPLPLTLHYLITAYGADEGAAHKVLGQAMSILHDHPLLSPQEIATAAKGNDASKLESQVERVKVTPLPLSTHDLFELWSGFATNYRISAAYEVSVVLIDSTRLPRAPLPVLRRGPSAITGGDPVLAAVLPPEGSSVITPGATARVLGSGLDTASGFQLARTQWPKPLELKFTHVDDKECSVELAAADGAAVPWVSGFYQLSAYRSLPVTDPAGEQRRVVSNSIPLAVAPSILRRTEATVDPGDIDVDVECRPPIAVGQDVLMLLGSATATPIVTAHHGYSLVTAKFAVVSDATYTIRLRVDRVDSDPVIYPDDAPTPRFNPDVQVAVT